MADYRLYWLRGGHIYRREEFSAADDAAALAELQMRGWQGAGELWTGARKVASLGSEESVGGEG